MKNVAIKPPMKKHTVATIDEVANCETPIMACPAVHPLAYRAPNPIKNPPAVKINRDDTEPLNNSDGTYPTCSLTPYSDKAAIVLSDIPIWYEGISK